MRDVIFVISALTTPSLVKLYFTMHCILFKARSARIFSGHITKEKQYEGFSFKLHSPN